MFPDLLAQTAIFVSSPGPCKFCFARAFWLIATNSVGISSKEKRLTGLHQNQNFGQVALEFYLAEALSNLPEFGSEQTMKYETTSRLSKWNSPLTLANWFHSMVPFCKYRAKSRRDMRIWKKNSHNNEHNQSSRSGMPGPCQIYVYYYLSCRNEKIGTQWIHVSTTVNPKLEVGRGVIYCMH